MQQVLISYEQFCIRLTNSIKFVLEYNALFIKLILKFIWQETDFIRKTVSWCFKKLWNLLRFPFYKVYFTIIQTKKEIDLVKKAKGKTSAALKKCELITDLFFADGKILVTLLNYIMPIICAIFLFSIVANSNLKNVYSIRLTVNGEFLGYIENELVWQKANAIVNQRVKDLKSSKVISMKEQFSLEKVKTNDFIDSLTPYKIAEYILANSGISVEYAYGIYIDNELLCAVLDNQPIKETLSSLLNDYKTQYSITRDNEINFVSQIDCDASGLYITESIIDSSEVIRLLKSTKDEFSYYDVKEEDTPEKILQILGVSDETIEKFNPGLDLNSVKQGDKICFSDKKSYLDIAVTKDIVYTEEIPYKTEYSENNLVFVGTDQVYTTGENGVRNVTARISMINGEEVRRTIISEEVITEPINEHIIKGSRPIPSGAISTEIPASGKFIRPTYGGVIEWGWWNGGYSGHTGVDFQGGYGDPIFAAGGGTVIVAKYTNSSYGNYVKIQHPNGLQTLYAHCSKLYVTQGQVVAQGESIAAIGATGRAFGNHLHWEVFSGGVKVNPRNYLNGY